MYFFWVQNIKVPVGMGHPCTCTSILLYMCPEGLRVTNLQTEFKYLNSFTLYRVFYDLGFFGSRRAEQVGGGVSGDTEGFPYMPTYMCHGIIFLP